jgi:hypothetical protein
MTRSTVSGARSVRSARVLVWCVALVELLGEGGREWAGAPAYSVGLARERDVAALTTA